MIVGPVIQNDLIITILRFRQHRIAVIAYVAKMYRMVLVPEKDQHQRILWRDTPEEPVKTFELLTVTYGMTLRSAGHKMLEEAGRRQWIYAPDYCSGGSRGFCIDDMLANTVPKAQQLMNEVIELTKTAGFIL